MRLVCYRMSNGNVRCICTRHNWGHGFWLLLYRIRGEDPGAYTLCSAFIDRCPREIIYVDEEVAA